MSRSLSIYRGNWIKTAKFSVRFTADVVKMVNGDLSLFCDGITDVGLTINHKSFRLSNLKH